MRHLNYKNWAEYLLDLVELYPIQTNNVLELGAGSGNVSKYLTEKFSSYFITDISFEMLSKSDLKRKCVCDMQALPFKREFDLIFSIFDSVNYLITPERFIRFLKEGEQILSPNGILSFDVSLEKNSKANIRGLNRKGVYKGIRYKQISFYDESARIHKNVLELIINGEHFIETHLQKIYKFQDYFEFAEEANLEIIDSFDCFSFNDSNKKSERVQFVLRKK